MARDAPRQIRSGESKRLRTAHPGAPEDAVEVMRVLESQPGLSQRHRVHLAVGPFRGASFAGRDLVAARLVLVDELRRDRVVFSDIAGVGQKDLVHGAAPRREELEAPRFSTSRVFAHGEGGPPTRVEGAQVNAIAQDLAHGTELFHVAIHALRLDDRMFVAGQRFDGTQPLERAQELRSVGPQSGDAVPACGGDERRLRDPQLVRNVTVA